MYPVVTITKSKRKQGSALILTVVLTSLLALVGVLFVLVSRLDRTSVRGRQEAARLDAGVDMLLLQAKLRLANDVPGGREGTDYYDYPDANNRWLASLEPRDYALLSDVEPGWPQISDVTGYLEDQNWRANDILVRDTISDSNAIELEDDGTLKEQRADADGDGIADAKWILLDSSDPDKPLYAAARIIDHGGMINVNTAHAFSLQRDRENPSVIDGRDPMQVDLLDLSLRGVNGDAEERLAKDRVGTGVFLREDWLQNVIQNIDFLSDGYTPYDLADELLLRYRYVIGKDKTRARIEDLWTLAFEGESEGPTKPLPTPAYPGKKAWFEWVTAVDFNDATAIDAAADEKRMTYDYRHICTTTNMDRLIAPTGLPMANINEVVRDHLTDPSTLSSLIEAIKSGMDIAEPNRSVLATQWALNLVDFADSDSEVTAWPNPSDTDEWLYGLEPQPFIRQIGFHIKDAEQPVDQTPWFMAEIHNPFGVAINLERYAIQARVRSDGPVVIWTDVDLAGHVLGPNRSLFVVNTKEENDLARDLSDPTEPADSSDVIENSLFTLADYDFNETPPVLNQSFDLFLVRGVEGLDSLVVDFQSNSLIDFSYWSVKGSTLYFARGGRENWRLIRPEWQRRGMASFQGLRDSFTAGVLSTGDEGFDLPDPGQLLRGGDQYLRVGDILQVLAIGAGRWPSDKPGPPVNDTLGQKMQTMVDAEVRLSLERNQEERYPFSSIFQHVTTVDAVSSRSGDSETRVKGRININTAPWFVISRLPWITDANAMDIVNDRDSGRPFQSIGDLARLEQFTEWGSDGLQAEMFDDPCDARAKPHFTPEMRMDDLEETHLKFAAVSNLATVRSDIFSAYMVVRLGFDGPQKRVYALLDRTDVTQNGGKVKVLLRQTVPDAR